MIALILLLLAADEPPFATTVVGFEQDEGHTVLIRLEQPLARGRPARLYLVQLVVRNQKPSLYQNAYDGLSTWEQAHPSASDAEWQAEAKRLRNAAWKRTAPELKRWSGIELAAKSVPVPPSGPIPVPALGIVIQRACNGGSCDLYTESKGQRVYLTRGADFASLWIHPKKSVLVGVEAATSYTPHPKEQLSKPSDLRGVHAYWAKELVPGGSPTVSVGDLYLGAEEDADVRVRTAPSLAAEPLGLDDYLALKPLRVRGPVQDDFVPVQERGPDGAWLDGFVQGRYLRRLASPGVRALVDLELQSAISANPPRYRIVARNRTSRQLVTEEGQVGQVSSPTSAWALKQVGRQVIAPGAEIVLVDEPLKPSASVFGNPEYAYEAPRPGGGTHNVTAAFIIEGKWRAYAPAFIIEGPRVAVLNVGPVPAVVLPAPTDRHGP